MLKREKALLLDANAMLLEVEGLPLHVEAVLLQTEVMPLQLVTKKLRDNHLRRSSSHLPMALTIITII
jgi:hypothetical protein